MSAAEQKDSQEAKQGGMVLKQIIDGKEHIIATYTAEQVAEQDAKVKKFKEQTERDHKEYLELLKLPFDKRKEAYTARCGDNKKLFLEITGKLEMFIDEELPRDYSIVLDNGEEKAVFEAQEFMGAYRDVNLACAARGTMSDWTFILSVNTSKPVMPSHKPPTGEGDDDDKMPALVESD